jgi:hypothetical protein
VGLLTRDEFGESESEAWGGRRELDDALDAHAWLSEDEGGLCAEDAYGCRFFQKLRPAQLPLTGTASDYVNAHLSANAGAIAAASGGDDTLFAGWRRDADYVSVKGAAVVAGWSDDAAGWFASAVATRESPFGMPFDQRQLKLLPFKSVFKLTAMELSSEQVFRVWHDSAPSY